MATKEQKVGRVPNLRFPGFEGEWEEKKLGEIAERVIRKNKENNQNILTISAQFGLISQLEFFNKSVSAKDVTGYYLLHKNDFAYNKSYSNGYPMGAIKRLNRYEKGVVSTLYICFKFIDCIDNTFVEQSFETGNQNSEIEKVAQEGARNHGLLNIGVSDFFNIKLIIPSLPEQIQIASFLTLIDERIQCQNKIIERLETLMKEMSEKLFSKKLRLKSSDGSNFSDWKTKRLREIGTFFSGGTPLTSKKHYYNGDIPFIKSGEINSDQTEQFISDLGLKESSAKMVKVGDVIYALYGATSGEVGISKINGAINQAILCIRTDLNNVFLMNYLKQKKEIIIKTYLQGGQGNLSAEIIKNLEVPIPCLPEQAKIADFLYSIDEKIEIEKQILDQYKNQKAYLLQNMFV